MTGSTIFSLLNTARYNAISLDEVSLIFIQNLAVADFLYTLISVFPPATSYIATRYVLGDVFCFISAHFSFIPASASTITILFLTGYKLKMVIFPFSTSCPKITKALVAVIWLLSTTITIITLAYRSESVFNPITAKCLATIYTDMSSSLALQIAVGVIFILPVFFITFFNAAILIVAVRSANRYSQTDRINFRPIFTISALASIFILSWIPFIIFTFVKERNAKVSQLIELLPNFIYISSFANPILYTSTSKRFRAHVKGLIDQLFSRMNI